MVPEGVNRTTFASCLGTIGVLGECYLGQHPSCKCYYLSTHPPTSKPPPYYSSAQNGNLASSFQEPFFPHSTSIIYTVEAMRYFSDQIGSLPFGISIDQ